MFRLKKGSREISEGIKSRIVEHKNVIKNRQEWFRTGHLLLRWKF